MHQLKGTKKYFSDLKDAIAYAQTIYPKIYREGSVGSWSFYYEEKLVGEAWLHRTKPGWWLRLIKPKPGEIKWQS